MVKDVGRLTLVETLGEGAVGLVFQALTESASVVAVKVLHPEVSNRSAAIARFRKECRVLAEIDSPAITSIIEVGDDRGLVYFAMEFVPGQSLRHLLQNHGPMPPSRAIRVIRQVAWALSQLHQKGIVHRDVKPSNVLVNLKENDLADLYDSDSLDPLPCGSIKLSDLGLASDVGSVAG